VDLAKRSQFLAKYCFFFQLGAEELSSPHFTSSTPSIEALPLIREGALNGPQKIFNVSLVKAKATFRR
jgi:hypothetical protein